MGKKTKVPEEKTTAWVKVREGRIPLYVGAIDTAFFTLSMIFSFLSVCKSEGVPQAIGVSALFSPFVLLGLILLLSYGNRSLVLTEQECVYTTWTGRRRVFAFEEIGCLEQVIAVGSATLVLRGRENRKLAQFETNMLGAGEALAWLEERNIERKEKQWRLGKQIDPEWERKDWADNPSWQLRSFTGIRTAVRAAWIGAIVFCLLSVFLLGARASRVGWTLLPLVLYGLFLAFPEVMVLEKPQKASKKWQQSHMSFPILPYMILMLFSLIDVRYIELLDGGWAFIFGAVLFVLLFWAYLARVPKKRRTLSTNSLAVIIVLLYSFTATYHINYVLRIQPPVHTQVQVYDGRVTKGKNSSYYLEVLTTQGESRSLSVSKSMYQLGQQEGRVVLCDRVSIFGIRYELVHGLTN